MNVTLRPVEPRDLDMIYEHQADREAARRVVFTPRERPAFDAHWATILADPACRAEVVEADGEPVGSIMSWDHDGYRYIGYWLGREHWGRGIATAAVTAFLDGEERPVWADPFESNAASVRVLLKCGFREVRRETGPQGMQVILVKDG